MRYSQHNYTERFMFTLQLGGDKLVAPYRSASEHWDHDYLIVTARQCNVFLGKLFLTVNTVRSISGFLKSGQ